ncbi:MAG TPA: hypothetical protein VG164_02260 [Trebonia sp.]|nr:hypothetical protein [Trebonia sp.]
MGDRTRQAGEWWRAAWPCWLLVLFVVLALARLLPAGYVRAAVAVPLFWTVPGALTFGAAFGKRRIPGLTFGFLAVLLSVIWTAFASLMLYVLGILITELSTYLCLLVVCVLLAAAAQYRLRRDTSAADQRAARPADLGGFDPLEFPDTSPVSGLPAAEADRPRGPRGACYVFGALAGGLALLAAGTYTYVHLPHPKAAGYTWLAWSGSQVKGVIPVGAAGTSLPFQIRREEPGTGAFRLTAVWTGSSGKQHPLTKPETVRVGADKTVSGALTIPAPPGGCTYRVVVTLTETGQGHPRTWSVNADVRNAARRQNACASL